MKRLEYVDVAKALAILLVILGHSPIGCIPYLGKAIYSFHMPIFFIAAGMFLRPMKIQEAFKKYFRRLMIPYFVTCFIAFLTISFIIIWKEPIVTNWAADFFLRAAFGSGGFCSRYLSNVPIIGPLWFLWCMFWACVIWSWISSLSHSQTFTLSLHLYTAILIRSARRSTVLFAGR